MSSVIGGVPVPALDTEQRQSRIKEKKIVRRVVDDTEIENEQNFYMYIYLFINIYR